MHSEGDSVVQQTIGQARALAQQGNSQAATALLSKLIQSDSSNVEAWLALADVVDEPDRAEFCLHKVLELDPGNEIALAKLSRAPSGSLSVGSVGLNEDSRSEEPIELEAPVPVQAVASQASPDAGPPVEQADMAKAPAGASAEEEPPGEQAEMAKAPAGAQAAVELPGELSTLTKRFGRTDLILIGLTVAAGAVLCALVGAAIIGSSSLFSRQPAESPDQVVQVVFNNIIAANREDLAAYMGTIHPDAPGYNTTQAEISSAFSLYDLSYVIFIPEMLEQGNAEATISYVLTTRRVNGPAFQDNTVTGEMTLRKFGEEWRIYDQTVDDVQYLN